jgi:hypothetical protein
MHSDERRPTGTYRTGSPRDYLLGAALLIVAAWFAHQFLHDVKFHRVDRPIMATISALTFGGIGLFMIMRGGVRGLILGSDRLCIRDWTGRSRCFPIDSLRRLTWSYRYAGGLWGRYDQGRAWLELEFSDERGTPGRAVVDYAGRARHPEIEEFTCKVADRANLRWEPRGDPVHSTELPSAEVIWSRRRATG